MIEGTSLTMEKPDLDLFEFAIVRRVDVINAR